MSVTCDSTAQAIAEYLGFDCRHTNAVLTVRATSDLENWNFHWQEFYFYKGTPPVITPSTQLELTCEYNTSADHDPVLPGWGTRNEMCLNVLMVALPAQ